MFRGTQMAHFAQCTPFYYPFYFSLGSGQNVARFWIPVLVFHILAANNVANDVDDSRVNCRITTAG